MKFIILLTLFTTLNVSAVVYSQDARLNLSVQDKTLREALKMIEEQSNFRFFFSDDYSDLDRKVNMVAQNKGINEVLSGLLEQGTVTYKMLENNVIVITPVAEKQTDKISGVITDGATGEPLIGVNIIVKGTTRGVITDVDGKYTIEATSGDVLVVSYVGYLSEEITVAEQKTISLTLMPDVKKLDEVVVVGYGTMRKKDLTGSVTSVKAADIADNKTSNALQALQGKVAGLDLTQTSGKAGSDINISLRGTRSMLAGNDPLILVDGVEYGTKLDLNPSDIESVDILKDAASTAIYGTKGANGVIMITTKKGGKGKTKISYNMYVSRNRPEFVAHYRNGQEFLQKEFEIKLADYEKARWDSAGITYNAATKQVAWNQTLYPNPTGVFGTATIDQLVASRGVADKYELVNADPTFLQLARDGVSLDYLDMVLVDTWSQNHELSITGGNEKTAYNLSLGYMDDNGLMERDELKRYNVKLGLDQQLTKRIKVGANILLTRKYQSQRSGSVYTYARNAGPIGRLYNDDNITYREVPDPVFSANQYNPLLDNVSGAYINETNSNRLFGNAYLNIDLIKDLTFRSSFGVDYNASKQGIYEGGKSTARIVQGTSRTLLDNSDKFSYTWDNVLNYQKTLGIHKIQTMLGSSTNYNLSTRSRFIGYNQLYGVTEYYDWIGFGGSIVSDKDYLTSSIDKGQYIKKTMQSVFGRINYGLKDRYLFQVTMRYDAASVLSKGNKGATFPSASFGWRVSEEEFMKSLTLFNNLKLRYSWGISGNSAIDPYQSTAKVGSVPNYYTFESGTYSQYVPYQMANEKLTWELTQTSDFGLDFAILNDRIFGGIDYYISNTSDLLFTVPLPATEGYPVTTANVAASKNTGLEISLTTFNVKGNVFDWSTDWTFSHNKNEITRLREGTNELIQTDQNLSWKVGEPIQSYYTFEQDGFYSVEDLNAELAYIKAQTTAGDSVRKGMIPMIANKFLPGDIKLKDKNGDGNFTNDDKIYKSSYPNYTFSVNNNITLKTKVGVIGLAVQTLGRVGQTIRYTFYEEIKLSGDHTNGAYASSWIPTNTDAVFPRFYSTGTANQATYIAPIKFVDGSFIKIKDITLSYTLPNAWLNKIKVSNMRIYATARNMFTFSKIENYDPEMGGSVNFPLAKQMIFGLNLDF